MKRLRKFFNIEYKPDDILLEQAEAKSKESRKEYYNNKKNFKKWHLEFNTSLIDTLKEEEESPCSTILLHV